MACCCRRLTEAEQAALPECRKNLHAEPPSDSKAKRCLETVKENTKYILIFVGVLLGCVLGYFLKDVGPFKQPHLNPRAMLYFTFYAEILKRILRFISLPFTVFSIISGLSHLNTKISVKVAGIAILYYLATSILATAQGLLWSLVFNTGSTAGSSAGSNASTPAPPGGGNRSDVSNRGDDGSNPGDSGRHDDAFYFPDLLLDLVRNIFPDNFVSVGFETSHTSVSWKEFHPEGLMNKTTFIESYDLAPTRTPNYLGLTVWMFIFGIFMTRMNVKIAKLLRDVITALYRVTASIYSAALWFYPLAVLLLVARLTLEMSDPFGKVVQVSRLLLAVVVGQLTHSLLVLPLVFWLCTHRNPFTFLLGVTRALTMALASGDSFLTLPVTLEVLKSRVNPFIAQATCPLGGVFNRDGSAIYQVMVVVFCAKSRGMEMGVADLAIMGCVSLALTFGASHIRNPVVVYAVLFHMLNLPVEDLPVVITVHWIMVRLQVMVSVWSDCVGAAISDKLTREDQELLNYRNSTYRLLKYDMMDSVKDKV